MTQGYYHPDCHSAPEYVDACPICQGYGFSKKPPTPPQRDLLYSARMAYEQQRAMAQQAIMDQYRGFSQWRGR